MKAFKLFLVPLLMATPVWPASPSAISAQKLGLAAFHAPAVPFQARVILTEWRDGENRAEEARLYFSPPNSYRIEFLAFDGSVKKVVQTEDVNSYVMAGVTEKAPGNGPLQVSSLLTAKQVEDLLVANYTFELKGSETFIGRPVWALRLHPRTPGKPAHELKIDKQTLVVLEQRRYVTDDKMGSLTQFSTFEPNKVLAAELFLQPSQALAPKTDVNLGSAALQTPPESYRVLPAGFSLNGYRTFQVAGTSANHFIYTDGALPLSVFETKLPVRFPERRSPADKNSVSGPTELTSADQVVYDKKGNNYLTIVGEVSPDLLHNIADHFN